MHLVNLLRTVIFPKYMANLQIVFFLTLVDVALGLIFRGYARLDNPRVQVIEWLDIHQLLFLQIEFVTHSDKPVLL